MKWTLILATWLLYRAKVLADDDMKMLRRKDGSSSESRSLSQAHNNKDEDGSRPVQAQGLTLVYALDHCHSPSPEHPRVGHNIVYINTSVIVEAAHGPRQGNQMCVATFATHNSQERILLHFEKMAINYHMDTVDRLRIFDGYGTDKQLTPPMGLYGIYLKNKYQRSGGNVHDYLSTGPVMTIHFVGKITKELSGFRVLLTVFREAETIGLCPSGYLRCTLSGRCIPNSLMCNGYDNCGEQDYSDSLGCSQPQPSPDGDMGIGYSADLGLMVGCAISIVILMVVVLWLGIVCIKRTKRFRTGHRRYHSTQASHVPVPHSDVDGAIVEPADIHHIIAPPVSFLEPPPPYTAQAAIHPAAGDRELEFPPPYTVDEHDTAGLLSNESLEQSLPVETEGSSNCSALSTRELVPMMVAENIGFVRGEGHSSSSRNGIVMTMDPEVVASDDQTQKDEIEAATEAVVVNTDTSYLLPVDTSATT